MTPLKLGTASKSNSSKIKILSAISISVNARNRCTGEVTRSTQNHNRSKGSCPMGTSDRAIVTLTPVGSLVLQIMSQNILRHVLIVRDSIATGEQARHLIRDNRREVKMKS